MLFFFIGHCLCQCFASSSRALESGGISTVRSSFRSVCHSGGISTVLLSFRSVCHCFASSIRACGSGGISTVRLSFWKNLTFFTLGFETLPAWQTLRINGVVKLVRKYFVWDASSVTNELSLRYVCHSGGNSTHCLSLLRQFEQSSRVQRNLNTLSVIPEESETLPAW